MHKKFEIDRTKIKGSCQSGKKVVTHNSKSDLPLGEREDDLDIKQLPWMVALGSYQEEDYIEVNPRTQTRFASFEDGEAGPCDHVGEGFTLLDGKCKKWTHQCGASLITNKHILSAAHCFDGQDDPNLDERYKFKMRLGAANMNVRMYFQNIEIFLVLHF